MPNNSNIKSIGTCKEIEKQINLTRMRGREWIPILFRLDREKKYFQLSEKFHAYLASPTLHDLSLVVNFEYLLNSLQQFFSAFHLFKGFFSYPNMIWKKEKSLFVVLKKKEKWRLLSVLIFRVVWGFGSSWFHFFGAYIPAYCNLTGCQLTLFVLVHVKFSDSTLSLSDCITGFQYQQNNFCVD